MMLLDADIALFSSCAAAETEIEWEEDVWTITTDLKLAKEKFQSWIDKVMAQTDETEFVLCMTGPDNFRRKVYPPYKAKRGRKPVGYAALKEWAKENYKTFEKPTLEADDCLAILATKYPGKAHIATMDKDLLGVPGRMLHLNQKLEGTWVETDEKTAFRHFLYQTLTGDATDNYPGCPGVGPVGAEKLLKTKGAVWATVIQAFEKAGLTEEDALVQARCAWMNRIENWDAEKEEVILWTPPA
jgi:DNA polymerase-1